MAIPLRDTCKNPFQDLSLEEIYARLTSGADNLPQWPSKEIQKGYVGTHSIDLLRRSFQFIKILENDGAFVPDWNGLDYGCGFGRFASLLLTKGTPDQLDLCDAWKQTLRIISTLHYKNRVFPVSELLKPGEIPDARYDFILSFSVFTHLSPLAFKRNIPLLIGGLKSKGKLYFTVRHDEFIPHKYPDQVAELLPRLDQDQIVFLDSGGDMGSQKVFGDTIVRRPFLESLAQGLGSLRYLGQPHSLQHVYCVTRT